MNEDDFYRDFHSMLVNNVITDNLEESLLSIEFFVPEDLWEAAEEFVRDYFYVA